MWGRIVAANDTRGEARERLHVLLLGQREKVGVVGVVVQTELQWRNRRRSPVIGLCLPWRLIVTTVKADLDRQRLRI